MNFAEEYKRKLKTPEEAVKLVKDGDWVDYSVGIGFPVLLDAALAKMGEKVDFAINVEVPDENIVNRMSGRRACVGCGATYHIKYNAPKTEDICDVCGEKLVLREDDQPETVLKRLGVYHDQTQPLIEYYAKAGVLKEVDGTVDMEDVFQAIVSVLGE